MRLTSSARRTSYSWSRISIFAWCKEASVSGSISGARFSVIRELYQKSTRKPLQFGEKSIHGLLVVKRSLTSPPHLISGLDSTLFYLCLRQHRIVVYFSISD